MSHPGPRDSDTSQRPEVTHSTANTVAVSAGHVVWLGMVMTGQAFNCDATNIQLMLTESIPKLISLTAKFLNLSGELCELK